MIHAYFQISTEAITLNHESVVQCVKKKISFKKKKNVPERKFIVLQQSSKNWTQDANLVILKSS